MIDHRASPGITPEDLIKAGLNPHMAVPGGQMVELATLCCGHCNAMVIKNPKRTRDRGHCKSCDDFICDGCVAIGGCYPLQAYADHVLGTDLPDNQLLLSPLLRVYGARPTELSIIQGDTKS